MKTFRSFQIVQRALPRPRTRHTQRSPLLRQCRPFQASALLQKIETHTLSDIGEGVKEVQIIQWFVEEGATVEEWAPLCEVQSDKASVEITSKFSGVIKKLHYERDAVVQVGDAMLDIEVEGEDEPEPEPEPEPEAESTGPKEGEEDAQSKAERQEIIAAEDAQPAQPQEKPSDIPKAPPPESNGKHASLATPAVRGLLKQHGLEVEDIEGTGKDGRVMKEDVHCHIEEQKQPQQSTSQTPQRAAPTSPALNAKQEETPQNMTPIQSAMFKSMTKSLSIPHFLYSDTINVTLLGTMRSRLNEMRDPQSTPKFSYMPFVIKALSLAMNKHPLLNARLDTSDSAKPKLLMRSNHNIGVAMDTPAGLLVPVIKTVNARSITSITQELYRLAELGAAGKLSNDDLTGGTITVSNIGNIGGGVVGPVIVEGQLAIMGMGKIKPTPVFAADGKTVERADLLGASWSADHRVVDGATMARMASLVQSYLERPETMIVEMS
ncbi:hypothetical protein LTR70_008834 [Exophiala xenobiotica]|uniref:Dihydrolipoamide acetyltransferase component of pyruvate dehydrogenase complex n=1 Tax=Lithohypha guttulata TaxID=1690604 RepID=A0ABR0JZV4_9EURO|nr:hypothetical protein LTR24_008506 [Lithohypha guttulata]KAK5311360.1 hypothetical protein LTR70_008834 [Exophiala xenobiotica]